MCCKIWYGLFVCTVSLWLRNSHFWITRKVKVTVSTYKFEKLNLCQFLWHYLLTAELCNLEQKVVWDKTFKNMQMKMFLAQGQGNEINLKWCLIELSPISQTLLTIELWNLDQKVEGAILIKKLWYEKFMGDSSEFWKHWNVCWKSIQEGGGGGGKGGGGGGGKPIAP